MQHFRALLYLVEQDSDYFMIPYRMNQLGIMGYKLVLVNYVI